VSSILKPLVELLHWVLIWIHDALSSMGLSEDWTWGLAIIGITIIVRLLMFPLTWKQYKSSRAMQALAPQIKELQKKHKGDRQLLQQETMRLYSENKVNPFSSCLPLIIQMPVFFALYYTIRGADYLPKAETDALYNAAFLWLPKLGEPDPYHILLVIYVATQLISTELMLTPETQGSQKWLMRGMPLIFVIVLLNFPSGLFVYWVTTNLWTIGQQLIIRKRMPIVTLEAAAAGSGGQGGKGGGKGGGKAAAQPAKKRGRFMEAIMAAQEQQAAQRKTAQGDAKAEGGTQGDAKGTGANKAAKQGGKQGAKKGGKRPPPGKGARAKPAAPAQDLDDDDKPPYR
jgi:YidC/Oxa1 family membrane protein insertase